MSLENAIIENTAAIRELVAAILTSANSNREFASAAARAVPLAEVGKEEKKPSTAKEAIDQATAAAKAAAEKKKAEAAAAAAKKDEKTDDAKPLDYEKDVKPELVKFAQAKGKPALAELLKGFGVAKGDQLKGDQFAEVLAKIASDDESLV